MSDKNINKKSSPADFIRYHGNKMTGEERNAFEKELQKDPFAEEASEGFSGISSDFVKDDLSILNKRLIKKSRPRAQLTFYRIAAAIAVLMIVSAIFFSTNRKDKSVTLSENVYKEKKAPVTITESDALSDQPAKVIDKKQVTPPPAPKRSNKDKLPFKNNVAAVQVAEPQRSVTKDTEDIKPDIMLISADEAAGESFAAEKKMNMARVAGIAASVKSEEIRNYIPPQPVVGKDSFDIFVEKNIRNPYPDNSDQQTVVIRFKVKADSTITGIKIISSPGKAWSKEAIRLIKEGPVWKPAEENGNMLEDEVSVRIIFR